MFETPVELSQAHSAVWKNLKLFIFTFHHSQVFDMSSPNRQQNCHPRMSHHLSSPNGPVGDPQSHRFPPEECGNDSGTGHAEMTAVFLTLNLLCHFERT